MARRRIWKHRLNPNHKIVLATVGLGGLLAAVVVLLTTAVMSSASVADAAVLRRVLSDQAALLLWGAVLALVVLGLVVARLVRRYVVLPRDLAAATRIVATINPAHRLPHGGPAELHQFAMAVNELAGRYEAERADVATRIAAARAETEADRSRLAALMADLTVAVLVCTADGRILLYNAAASQLFGGPAGPVGLGRSVFAVIDRDLVAFAMDQVGADTTADAPGTRDGSAVPASHSATVAWGDLLLRAHVTIVPDPLGDSGAAGGFVVTLEDLTREAASAHRQEELIRSLTTAARAAVGNLRAAVESVLDYPDMPAEQQQRFLGIVRDEAQALTERMDVLLAAPPDVVDRRLAPADMLGRDLVDTIARRLIADGLQVTVEDVDRPLWLVVDGYAVLRAVAHLGELLRREHDRLAVRLRLGRSGRYARLDLGWAGPPVDPRTLERWTTEPLASLGPDASVTVSEILHRHGGEIWPGEDTHFVYLRLLLPLAERPHKGPRYPVPSVRRGGSAPSAYDFSLLEPAGPDGHADGDLDRNSLPLDRLAYTVLDTETTGLFPAEGDEIISIGALRIVNSRLLRQETFEQLVDPCRTVPEASIRIHGITPDLLVGAPTIDVVLPRFAQFAEGTVLVGHNVAFDLQFLRSKAARTGVRFDQPVLDTLLLSAVVHPEHESHALDSIAERLGIDVIGRHTALGDAIVTGEVFLRLLDLLQQHGIRTLGEARDAARATAASRFSESLYTHQ